MAFFVYLIESEGNKQKRTYVGFTNDPKKRIRQQRHLSPRKRFGLDLRRGSVRAIREFEQ